MAPTQDRVKPGAVHYLNFIWLQTHLKDLIKLKQYPFYYWSPSLNLSLSLSHFLLLALYCSLLHRRDVCIISIPIYSLFPQHWLLGIELHWTLCNESLCPWPICSRTVPPPPPYCQINYSVWHGNHTMKLSSRQCACPAVSESMGTMQYRQWRKSNTLPFNWNKQE